MFTFWNILICALWPALYFYGPFSGTMRQRLGHFALGRYDPERAGLKVLINAVSAGEVNAITPFIHELKKSRPEAQVVVLTTTDSGLEMAQRKLGDDVELVTFFPLVDLPWATRRFLDKLRPDIYITTESELWPNIESQCRQRGTMMVLVNGRLYMHNKTGLRGTLARRLLSMLDLIICQDGRQRGNHARLGIPAERLAVSGNIKFDFELQEWDDAKLAQWKQQLDLSAEDRVVVAGSTHPGEEETILDAMSHLKSRPRLILAPRHIERVGEVKQLCSQHGVNALTLTEHEQTRAQWDVLIVDRYGVLVDMYRVADVVVMGGTFHPKVGGHNILEPTALGKPVVVGPHTFGIAAQVELLDAVGGLEHARDKQQLASNLKDLLTNSARAMAVGQAAREVTLANRGAAKRAADLVLQLVS